jgi:hypothetical protein
MRILIELITLMRILPFNLIRIHADPGPVYKNCWKNIFWNEKIFSFHVICFASIQTKYLSTSR